MKNGADILCSLQGYFFVRGPNETRKGLWKEALLDIQVMTIIYDGEPAFNLY